MFVEETNYFAELRWTKIFERQDSLFPLSRFSLIVRFYVFCLTTASLMKDQQFQLSYIMVNCWIAVFPSIESWNRSSWRLWFSGIFRVVLIYVMCKLRYFAELWWRKYLKQSGHVFYFVDWVVILPMILPNCFLK